MAKEITHKQFMKAWKKKVDAELIMSKYNKQEAMKLKPEDFVVCNCVTPLTYGVLSTECSRCEKPLKK